MTLEAKVEKPSSIAAPKATRDIDALRFVTPATLAGIVVVLIAAGMVYISLESAPGIIGLLGAALAMVMLAIAISDWRNFTIPDWLSLAGAGLALLHAAAQEPGAMVQGVALATLRGLVLASIFLALRYGYARYRGRQGLGLGDVKLAFVAGAWLDWLILPLAIQVAVFATLTGYLVRHFASDQKLSAVSRMPFGLFFAPAIWLSWLFEVRGAAWF